MTLSTQPYRGVRDFYPEDLALRSYIFDIWRKVLIENGFLEYDSSILESAEIYLAKSGEELGSKQLYSFTDKGDRHVALRPEMTPTLARMVSAKFGELKFPLRWFSIPNCFRYERPQKGRGREFWQLNADIIGLQAGEADLEILVLLGKIFMAFGAKKEMFTIRYGHRKWLDDNIQKMGLETHSKEIYNLLDNWKKMENPERQNFALELGLTESVYDSIQNFVGEQADFKNYPELELLGQSLAKILPEVDFVFDPTIVRGIAYYTGLVFEAFDNNPENSRAMFGGGRYDDLLHLFGKKAPAVGVGIGDMTWHEFLVGWKLYPEESSLNVTKIGILVSNQTKLVEVYTKIIPDLVADGKTFEINYEYDRSENKRYESLKKRDCTKIIQV